MKSACLESETHIRSTLPLFEPLAVLAARTAGALESSIHCLALASDQNLGHLEVQAAHEVQELLRQAIQRGARLCENPGGFEVGAAGSSSVSAELFFPPLVGAPV